jgi:L,D-peptidoglycan transpeptidase YkuD (ErfK/YbiS/YcfS/YnhG family)
MEIRINPEGRLFWREQNYRCALGKNGVTQDKREGDGKTPLGSFVLHRILFRPDKLAAPASELPDSPLSPQQGWCDAPTHALYNQQVRLPFEDSHEKLWREDGLYDVIVVLGHNDSPAIPYLGSAIFLHVASPDYQGTEGCVALALPDLLKILAEVRPGDRISIG